MKNFRSLILYLILYALALSCDAPHLNPLDPSNPGYKYGKIDGYVYTNSTPGHPIFSVRVFWKNQNMLALTDTNGYFKFDGLIENDGFIYYDKDGYVKDTLYVRWNNRTSMRVTPALLNFSVGSIIGSVKSQSGKIISGANVTLKSSGVTVLTDVNGRYQIDNISHNPNPDSLLFQATGYSSVTLPVSWLGSSEDVEVNASLNANPRLTDLKIFSSVVNNYTSSTASLSVQAQVSDEDVGDIDSVFVSCTDLNIKNQPLLYNFDDKAFEAVFDATTLPSIEDAIGKIFNIIVKDKEGRFFNVGSSFLKRIIRDQVTLKSPINGQVVGSQPLLQWRRFTPGFNFTYMVQVYTNATVPIKIWEKKNISQNDIETTVNMNLTSGQSYFWVIWCLDSYQNGSRSYPGTFVVQ